MISISKASKNKYTSVSDIWEVILWLKANGLRLDAHNWAYERHGKYRQLHFHGLARFTGLYNGLTHYGDNIICPYFKIIWSRVRDREGAIRYIFKNSYNRYRMLQVLAENFFENNYGFIKG